MNRNTETRPSRIVSRKDIFIFQHNEQFVRKTFRALNFIVFRKILYHERNLILLVCGHFRYRYVLRFQILFWWNWSFVLKSNKKHFSMMNRITNYAIKNVFIFLWRNEEIVVIKWKVSKNGKVIIIMLSFFVNIPYDDMNQCTYSPLKNSWQLTNEILLLWGIRLKVFFTNVKNNFNRMPYSNRISFVDCQLFFNGL